MRWSSSVKRGAQCHAAGEVLQSMCRRHMESTSSCGKRCACLLVWVATRAVLVLTVPLQRSRLAQCAAALCHTAAPDALCTCASDTHRPPGATQFTPCINASHHHHQPMPVTTTSNQRQSAPPHAPPTHPVSLQAAQARLPPPPGLLPLQLFDRELHCRVHESPVPLRHTVQQVGQRHQGRSTGQRNHGVLQVKERQRCTRVTLQQALRVDQPIDLESRVDFTCSGSSKADDCHTVICCHAHHCHPS